ncbi:hypothetical protein ACA910_017155 [Epithemia clementina (nom. ined.)]
MRHCYSALYFLIPAVQSFVTSNRTPVVSPLDPLTIIPEQHGWLLRQELLKRKCRQFSSTRRTATTITSEDSSKSTSSSMMELRNGVADIANQFDVFLLDMWGVMHDGSRPYDGVLEVIEKLRQMQDKKLIILSNSSKRKDNSVRMLKKLGFNPDDFHDIITSGEVAHGLLSGKLRNRWEMLDQLLQGDPLQKKVFVLGSGDNDVEYCESCGWQLTPIEEANLIVARGTFTVNDGSEVVNKRENEELYESTMETRLKQAALRRIPMLVTNPDKIRPDVERPPMPGKIGDRYEQILRETSTEECTGLVKRIGKPFQDVYDLALVEENAKENRNRVCMLGDALETDIVGGSINGISTVWVLLDGIYGPDLDHNTDDSNLMQSAEAIVKEFNGETGTYAGDRVVQPDIALRHFRW